MNFAIGVGKASFKRNKRMNRNLPDRKVPWKARGILDKENSMFQKVWRQRG